MSARADLSRERQPPPTVLYGMNRARIATTLAPALLLLACKPAQAPADTAAPPAASASPATAAPAPASPTAPDFAPPALTPDAEQGEKGARNVLLSFARAIEEKRFGRAWVLLSPADKRKWSRTRFGAIFAGLSEISVTIPEGTMEGAAGSSYYSAPVTVTGNDKSGRPVRIEGEAVLRRVNNVDGATPAQLRWHFERLTLEWTH